MDIFDGEPPLVVSVFRAGIEPFPEVTGAVSVEKLRLAVATAEEGPARESVENTSDEELLLIFAAPDVKREPMVEVVKETFEKELVISTTAAEVEVRLGVGKEMVKELIPPALVFPVIEANVKPVSEAGEETFERVP